MKSRQMQRTPSLQAEPVAAKGTGHLIAFERWSSETCNRRGSRPWTLSYPGLARQSAPVTERPLLQILLIDCI